MAAFGFLVQLVGFVVTVILVSTWCNRLIQKWFRIESNTLPVFSWGIFLFFIVYLLGNLSRVPVDFVRGLYNAFLIIVPLTFLGWRWWTSTKSLFPFSKNFPLSRSSEQYWKAGLTAIFVAVSAYVGVYLEFPSDPIYHLSFIQNWEAIVTFQDAPLMQREGRFSYFLNHWLLSRSESDQLSRWEMDMLAATLGGMLFWSYLHWATHFRLSKLTLVVVGLFSIFAFGNSVFSFYRYYPLGSNLLTFVVFVEMMIFTMFEVFYRRRIHFLVLSIPLLLICVFNHRQEALLYINTIFGVAALSLVFMYKSLEPSIKRICLILTISAILGGIGVVLARPIISQTSFVLLPIFELGDHPYYIHGIPRTNEFLGVMGWVSIGIAGLLLLYRKTPRLLRLFSMIVLWPVIIIFNPATVDILIRVVSPDTLYRLMFGSHHWFFLAIVGGVFLKRKSLTRANWLRWVVFVIFGFGLTFQSNDPYYGRWKHFLYRPPPQLDGSELQPLVEYLRSQPIETCPDPIASQNSHLRIRSYVLANTYVNSYLATSGYFYTVSTRRGLFPGLHSPDPKFRLPYDRRFVLSVSESDTRSTPTMSDLTLEQFQQRLLETQFCYIVLYPRVLVPFSWTGFQSQHWHPYTAQTSHNYSTKYLDWIRNQPKLFEKIWQQEGIELYRFLGNR